MTDLEKFDFDGLDDSAFTVHPELGPLVHEVKFMEWLGYDVSHKTRIEKQHLQPGDVVKGVFSHRRLETQGGRKADALTKRGAQRLMIRSNHPRAVEYTDRVLDMLDELDRSGMVIDEKRITDDQIAQGQQRLADLGVRRLEEKMDYKAILHALKLGGAVTEEYRDVQNALYVLLFGKTAAVIRSTQPQVNGTPRKRGEGFRKSTVAKDFMTAEQLALLNSTVLATIAQIQLRHPNGATAGKMLEAIHRAVQLISLPSGRAA